MSFTIREGETLGLVGESGSGKSVTAHSIMRLVEPPGRIDPRSHVLWCGNNLLSYSEREMRKVRGGEIAMVFQEPMTSLNPLYPIGKQLEEVLCLHERLSRRAARARACELLGLVGIPDPAERAHDYPHHLSGGMRQRVMIAMALSCNPRLLIADEPTTALDVTIQAQILDLIRTLTRERGTAVILITHDFGVVAEMASDVAVMYAGKIVERAGVRTIFREPKHPYTQALLRSIPRLGMDRSQPLAVIPGAVPSQLAESVGCSFAPRCSHAFDRCLAERPALVPIGAQEVSCWLHVGPNPDPLRVPVSDATSP